MFGDRPNHLIKRGALFNDAVDRERNSFFVKTSNCADGVERPNWRRAIKRFTDFPRFFLITKHALQIAPGHVEPKGIAKHMIKCAFNRNIFATRLKRSNEFDFVVVVFGEAGVGMVFDFSRRHVLNRICGLLKKEGGLACGV